MGAALVFPAPRAARASRETTPGAARASTALGEDRRRAARRASTCELGHQLSESDGLEFWSCINEGANAKLPADVLDLDDDSNLTEALPLDIDGAARVQGASVDMGAHEAL